MKYSEVIDMVEDLQHYGTARKSGRYEWGSGDNPQRSQDILSKVDDLKRQGFSETDRAKELGMNTAELRKSISWANEARKQNIMDSVTSRKLRGESNTAIAKAEGMSEASVRNYLKAQNVVKLDQLENITSVLKTGVDTNEYLDVGVGVERQMGISRTKLKTAISRLVDEEGYYQHDVFVKRLSDPKKGTTVKVLTKEPDLRTVVINSSKIRPVESWTDDGGKTFLDVGPIKDLPWDRVNIKFGDEGGTDRDGLIEMRRNVKDLDMGASNYAQVRISVGGKHYLKGMAVYSDDLPDGVDIRFNTNKPKGTPKEKVLKELKSNLDNPFGATIVRQNGALNIVNEEGSWSTWSSGLASQFLSKQPTKLVKERMDATYSKLKMDYDEISALTNPTVKKYLMDAYVDGLDSKAHHLKAQGLPRTKSHVILPFPDMNPNEVYAPNYNDGDRVVLLRYPHGGIFELPELTVNNKGMAKNTLKNAADAIGIHPSVASKISGADFDGDTVYVIPNSKRQIKTSRSLKELKNFEPSSYQVDHKTITPQGKQTQMGLISNLIADMSIKGASESELARAVRHSMVVIDSEKHNLDYKKSAQDNAIGALTKRYQAHTSPVTGKKSKAASTIVSRSKQEIDVTKDAIPSNGKVYNTNKVSLIDYIYDRDGSVAALSSGTAVENVYVGYVNKVKALSNKGRKESMVIPPVKRDRAVAKQYSAEVKTLDSKLNAALLNAPKERQAQIMAADTYYKNQTPDMDKDQKKKLRNQAIVGARNKVGASKELVDVTPAEWEAIQKGAISNTKLLQILKNTDMDKIKQLATPKEKVGLSSSKVTKANMLLDKGYTPAQVAESLGTTIGALRYALTEE